MLDEPPIRKRRAVIDSSEEDNMAKVRKVIAENSPDSDGKKSSTISKPDLGKDKIECQKRKLREILQKNDNFFSLIDKKFKTF